jgi:hypothetical protein
VPRRYLIRVVVPFLLQLLAHIFVFVAASGGVRRGRPLGSLTLTTLAIAIVPPILLLAFRFLVES